ncbi:MAG TPA: phenylalanine--tRNA ligase subunit alpha, partial [Pseudolysinimonas sp.]|nr:phenylalanine--tRNA ligase subunit alpha [Pseudolysinimonas sp.]
MSEAITESAVTAAVDAALAAISAAPDSAALRAARTAHAAEGSPLAQFNAAIRDLPGDQKAAAGKLVGGARARVNQALAAQEATVLAAEEQARLADEAVDVTAVPSRWRAGARHPLSLLMEQMSDLFISMGWEIGEGPELEHEWFNFDALNFDEDHP